MLIMKNVQKEVGQTGDASNNNLDFLLFVGNL